MDEIKEAEVVPDAEFEPAIGRAERDDRVGAWRDRVNDEVRRVRDQNEED